MREWIENNLRDAIYSEQYAMRMVLGWKNGYDSMENYKMAKVLLKIAKLERWFWEWVSRIVIIGF